MIFKEIKMTHGELNNYEYLGSGDKKTLQNLSKINIFVGQNNSGKSRLLRGLSKIADPHFIPSGIDYEKMNSFVKESVEGITNILQSHNSKTLGNIQSERLPAVQPDTHFNKQNNSVFRLEPLFDFVRTQDLGRLSQNGQNMERCHASLKQFVEERTETLNQYLKLLRKGEPGEYKRMYIPVLRGLRPLGESEIGDVFHKRTNKDYYDNSAGNGNFVDNEIFTGLELYESIRKRLLGTQEERRLVRDFEIFLSENFFDNQTVTLIPAHDADVLTVSIGDVEKRIFDLGDGIQSIIILNYPIFEFVRKSPKDTLQVFVEEPELYIHPGLQRTLLERWEQSDYKNVQFFVTTHSNHFLDMTIDFTNISIFRVTLNGRDKESKNNTFLIQNLSTGDRSLLEELGVRNSSVFLSNATIWVEGISDRIYLRKYLELYLKKLKKTDEYKEDLHYSFVEYGGGNLPHWSFDEHSNSTDESIRTSSIVSDVFLVADRDDTHIKKQSEKAKRLKELKVLLGAKNIHITQAREIENIISWSILKKTILSRGDSIKERLNESRIIEKMVDSPLGELIQSEIIDGEPKRKYKSSKSDTIHDKPRFAKEVCDQLESFDDLSNEAKKLTKSVYKFIVKSNS